ENRSPSAVESKAEYCARASHPPPRLEPRDHCHRVWLFCTRRLPRDSVTFLYSSLNGIGEPTNDEKAAWHCCHHRIGLRRDERQPGGQDELGTRRFVGRASPRRRHGTASAARRGAGWQGKGAHWQG